MTDEKINKNLVAPCGTDCGICLTHLRDSNQCPGCNALEKNAPKTRTNCKIRNCHERKGRFCFKCDEFPCAGLKHLDDRYRKKYQMSQIENLEFIRDKGVNGFIKSERKKHESQKGILCVNDKKYY